MCYSNDFHNKKAKNLLAHPEITFLSNSEIPCSKIKLHLMDAVPSMLAKPADMFQLEFQNIERRIPLSDNTLLNVVVQRIT